MATQFWAAGEISQDCLSKRHKNRTSKKQSLFVFNTTTSMSQQIETVSNIDEDKLRAALPANPFFIPHDQVERIKTQFNVTDDELLYFLATKVAPSYARAAVSHFLVGAAGLTSNGNIFLGTNLEFPPLPLNNSVHGEQFLVSQLVMHREERLKKVAINAVPCGHCRQFFTELNHIDQVQYFLKIDDR
jgi:cytidine deaminase